jgi:hypothetical protein
MKLTCVWNFVSKILDPINFEKHNKNYIVAFDQNGSRIKLFEGVNRVTSIRCCLSGFSDREVTLYQ